MKRRFCKKLYKKVGKVLQAFINVFNSYKKVSVISAMRQDVMMNALKK